MTDDLRIETDRYIVECSPCDSTGGVSITVRSRDGSGRKAVHTVFSLLDESGNTKETPVITSKVAEFILKGFKLKGETESFTIFTDELASGIPRIPRLEIAPDLIRHRKTPSERNFTATGEKLPAHWPIFQKFRETGYPSIIRATMTLHQVCSSRCHYCSTIRRNRADSISLEEAVGFVRKLDEDQALYNRERFPKWNDLYRQLRGSDIRLRGLILSGGGQPNLWPHFVPFVNWCASRGIDLGLITNGFPPHLPENIYENFSWVRLSITPEDASPHYPEGRCDLQYIPATLRNSSRTTFGLSYVYGPWTTNDILLRLGDALESWGAKYCRFLADCNLSRSAQLAAHRNLAECLFRHGFIAPDGTPIRRVFHQLKFHGEAVEGKEIWREGFCYLQLYNLFWDTTGHEENGFSWVYPCDSVTVLSEETDDGLLLSERRFAPDKWGMVKSTEVERLYNRPLTRYFDPRKLCGSCLFMRNNRLARDLAHLDRFDDLAIPPDLEHVNFP